MANGGWIIVLVIIALAITTGFLVAMNDHLLEVQDVQHAALKSRVEVEATLYAKETEDANTIHQLETQVADLQGRAATQSAAQAAWQQRERELTGALSTAQAGKTQAGGTIRSGSAAPRDSVVGSVQATPIPLTGRPRAEKEGVSLPWLPVAGIGFFGTMVIAAYRMLKLEDQVQEQTR